MTNKSFVRKLGISATDEKKIAEAVENVEKKTNGEISLAIVKQSDDYSVMELLLAISFSFIVAIVFIIFSKNIREFLSRFFWHFSDMHFLLAFFISSSLPLPIIFAILNIGSFERIFIPKRIRYENVKKRAMLHFVENGLYRTKDSSGILIFVSVLEHVVFVFADEGIHKKTAENTWNEICSKLVIALKNKEAGKGFVEAVQTCGEILKELFPAQDDNPNELSNSLAILER